MPVTSVNNADRTNTHVDAASEVFGASASGGVASHVVDELSDDFKSVQTDPSSVPVEALMRSLKTVKTMIATPNRSPSRYVDFATSL